MPKQVFPAAAEGMPPPYKSAPLIAAVDGLNEINGLLECVYMAAQSISDRDEANGILSGVNAAIVRSNKLLDRMRQAHAEQKGGDA